MKMMIECEEKKVGKEKKEWEGKESKFDDALTDNRCIPNFFGIFFFLTN